MPAGLLQPTQLIILLIVALVVLGPKRLPEAGRALGHGLKGFKSAIATAKEPRARHGIATPTQATATAAEDRRSPAN